MIKLTCCAGGCVIVHAQERKTETEGESEYVTVEQHVHALLCVVENIGTLTPVAGLESAPKKELIYY